MADTVSVETQRPKIIPAEFLLKVVLTGTQAHFETPGLLDDRRMEHSMQATKQVMFKTQQESEVRQALGFSPNVWNMFTDVFAAAIPSLQRRSFAPVNGSDETTLSSTLIANNYASLVKDIERMSDFVTITRNLLATDHQAQDLAADAGFDQQILKLIDICVRITARVYDGDTGTRNEEKYQKIVNLYKRLLITSLQFLHNLIMGNEHRKLVLWLDLFGSSQSMEPYAEGQLEDGSSRSGGTAEVELTTDMTKDGDVEFKNWSTSLGELRAALCALSDPLNPPEGMTVGEATLLANKLRENIETISGVAIEHLSSTATKSCGCPSTQVKIRLENAPSSSQPQPSDKNVHGGTTSPGKAVANALPKTRSQFYDWTKFSESAFCLNKISSNIPTMEDMAMLRTPQSAALTLKAAKDQLMARLQEPIGEEAGDLIEDQNGEGVDGPASDVAVNDNIEEEEDDDDDEYHEAGNQERGLLTDIPLILGPTEIEALPMILQAGIVEHGNTKLSNTHQEARKMQAVRCHILLAQEGGRSLLRELLIFVAAWDLPEEEFYFKMMVQIMNAIHQNGLMQLAYQSFGQAKDIISPAQAVLIKILTHIFRTKQGTVQATTTTTTTTTTATTTTTTTTIATTSSSAPSHPNIISLTRIDVLLVRYIFTVFRSSIIPETCALIYLQGQIRAGKALPEDFPLNLWDMERVYEGVYQFLEFFAVLTESNEWKSLLVKWEITSELVTLLRELDQSIPKSNPLDDEEPADPNNVDNEEEDEDAHPPVAVERPYDPTPLSPQPAHAPVPPASPPLGSEDPSDFEWRNLKKLVVLVISSLVWKSGLVQRQVRMYGGIPLILSCCNADNNNPYIREHAIMCLRFLLEGNRENQKEVEELEARRIVPDEVLDKRGYETFIDVHGKVGLRRKETQAKESE